MEWSWIVPVTLVATIAYLVGKPRQQGTRPPEEMPLRAHPPRRAGAIKQGSAGQPIIPIEAPFQAAARAAAQRDEENFNLGPELARPTGMVAVIQYADAQGEVTERTINISVLHGQVQDGRALIRYVAGFCHLRRQPRTFSIYGILNIRGPQDAPGDAATGLPAIGRWLRERAGLAAASDVDWRQKEAVARAFRLREHLRDAMTGGDEFFVAPTSIRLIANLPGEEAPEDRDMHVLMFDTDLEGRPSVLYAAVRASAKRGRPYFLAARGPDDRAIVALHHPPQGPPVADIAAWVAALPRRHG